MRLGRNPNANSGMTSRIALFSVLMLAPACADSLFYRPVGRHVPPPSELGVVAEEVTFSADGGPLLHGWWFPAVGEVRGTVVYCHGNRGHLGFHVDWVKWLPSHGYQVLLFDYRGYGKSDGQPTRAGTVCDAIAAIDFALARDAKRVVVYGHSLGGAIAISAVAQRSQVRGVIAESTFPSYRAAACGRVPWLGSVLQFLVSNGEDPEDVLDRIPPRPLLVIHGDEDGIVPLSVGLQLFERAAVPKCLYVVAGSGHRTPWVREGARFEARLVQFVEHAIRAGNQKKPDSSSTIE
jgi:uncharacterized protein